MPSSHLDNSHMFEPVSSSAFFIRNDATGNELLIFGDVEPDSVSLSPRNHVVWDDAAGKVAEGRLKAVFIECSYDDNTRDEDLYGNDEKWRQLGAQVDLGVDSLEARITPCRRWS